MTSHQGHNPRLPINNNLTLIYVLSLLIAVLTAAGSIAGIVYRTDVYPTEKLLGSSVANDILNLALGVPILLGSMVLAWRGKLIGLLFWPGALLYILYNEIGYTFSLPLSGVFPLHLALVPLCAYTVIGLVAAIDEQAVQQRLAGTVPERVVGGYPGRPGALVPGAGHQYPAECPPRPGPPDRTGLWYPGGGRDHYPIMGRWRYPALAAHRVGVRGRPGAAIPGQHDVCRRDRGRAVAAAPEYGAVQPSRRRGACRYGVGLLHPLCALCAWGCAEEVRS